MVKLCVTQSYLDEEEKATVAVKKEAEDSNFRPVDPDGGEDAQIASEMMGELEALLSGGPPPSKSKKRSVGCCFSLHFQQFCFFFI